MSTVPRAPVLTWPRLTALALGVFFTGIGLVGFRMTGVHDFFGPARHALLGFTLNPFHNAVHLLLGGTGLALSGTAAAARAYGWLLATVYGAGFVYGLFAAGRGWDQAGLNWPDNVVHVVVTLVGVALAASSPPTGLGERAARA